MALLYEVIPILYTLPIIPGALVLISVKFWPASRLNACLFILFSYSYCFAIAFTFPLERLPIPFSYYYHLSLIVLWPILFTAIFIKMWRRKYLSLLHNVNIWLSIFLLVSCVYFLSIGISALARPGGVTYVRLNFPLKNGTFFISCGGNSVFQNHHAIYGSSQKFGYDIEQLNSLMNRSKGFFSRNPKDYFIYEENVYSPLNGTIVSMVNNLNDGLPYQRQANEGAGNFVIIQSGEVKVLLAHLIKGSILVHVGQKIKVGDIIGQVGLSGDTMEPHLHIHAYKGKVNEMLSGGIPLPILFNERFLRRSDIINMNN